MNEHSPNYKKVKDWWDTFHNKAMIRNAVLKGWITAEEYAEITGEQYQ